MSDISRTLLQNIEQATKTIARDMDRLVITNQRLIKENERLTKQLKALTEDNIKVPEAPKDEPKEVFYCVGDRFSSPHATSGTHLLCQTGYGEVNLVDLAGGNRLTKPLTVESAYKISKDVFDVHFAGIGEECRVWRKVS